MNECVCIYTHRVFIGMWGLRESVEEFGAVGIKEARALQSSSRTELPCSPQLPLYYTC